MLAMMAPQLPTADQVFILIVLSVSSLYVGYYYHCLVQSQADQIQKLQAEIMAKATEMEEKDDLIIRQIRNYRALEGKYFAELANKKSENERSEELEATYRRLLKEWEEKKKQSLEEDGFLKSDVFEGDVDLKGLTWNSDKYLLVLTKKEADIWKKKYASGRRDVGAKWSCERFGYSQP
jgi:hypothetical protein